MKKYEYKKERVNSSEFEEQLNKLGNEGWELIQFDNNRAIFKRELPAIYRASNKDSRDLLQESYNKE